MLLNILLIGAAVVVMAFTAWITDHSGPYGDKYQQEKK